MINFDISQFPLFITAFPVGLIFWLIGLYFVKYPPKKINPLMGYRTPRSMKNQESWDFAQVYSSELFKKYGLLIMLISFVDFGLPEWEIDTKMILAMAVILLPIAYIIFKTERALKEKFGETK